MILKGPAKRENWLIRKKLIRNTDREHPLTAQSLISRWTLYKVYKKMWLLKKYLRYRQKITIRTKMKGAKKNLCLHKHRRNLRNKASLRKI